MCTLSPKPNPTQMKHLRYILFFLLVTVAPFHAFLVTWLKVGAASAWRETLVLVICVVAVIEILIQRKKIKFDLLDWFVIAFIGLALVWAPLEWGNKMQWLLGIRFDVMPLVLFLCVRHVPWEKVNRIRGAAILAGTVVVVFGLLLAFALPKDFLMHLGYSDYQGEHRPDTAITGCQYLESTDAVCRAISTFGAPTRYGTYLLLLLGLIAPLLVYKNKFRPYMSALAILIAGSVVATYSRSIWLGAFVMGVAWLMLELEWKERVRVLTILAIGLAVAGGSLAWQVSHNGNSLLKTILVRNISTGQHIVMGKEGLQKALQHPLGMGLGTSGPATVYTQKSLTENWYLQIAIELGVLGLGLFLAIHFLLCKYHLADAHDWRKKGLFLSLIGIAAAGLLTHAFEETTTVIMLYGFAGIYLSAPPPPHTHVPLDVRP